MDWIKCELWENLQGVPRGYFPRNIRGWLVHVKRTISVRLRSAPLMKENEWIRRSKIADNNRVKVIAILDNLGFKDFHVQTGMDTDLIISFRGSKNVDKAIGQLEVIDTAMPGSIV